MKTMIPSQRFLSRRRVLHLLCGLPAVLMACGNNHTGPQAPEINYGYDTCAHCGMVIVDTRYAAATTLKSGDVRKFDNVADMIAFHAEHPDQTVSAWWAHDYRSQQWIDALQSHYVLVQGKDTCSSLQKDIVAFGDATDGEAFATEHNETIKAWDKVRLAVYESEHQHAS